MAVSSLPLTPVTPAAPPLYREDLQWHEQPFWYLLTVVCCAMGGVALSLGLFSLARRSVLLWVLFLYIMGGLAFGGGLAGRYLWVLQRLWTTYRRPYRPMWWLKEGREVGVELFGGWFIAGIVGWKLAHDMAVPGLILRALPESAWIITLFLGLQFGLWSGVTLMWPVYGWLRGLPSRNEEPPPSV